MRYIDQETFQKVRFFLAFFRIAGFGNIENKQIALFDVSFPRILLQV